MKQNDFELYFDMPIEMFSIYVLQGVRWRGSHSRVSSEVKKDAISITIFTWLFVVKDQFMLGWPINWPDFFNYSWIIHVLLLSAYFK